MPQAGYSDNDSVMASANDWVEITPSDTATLQPKPKALYIGIGGTLVLESAMGNIASFDTYDGQVLTCRPLRVHATGTEADDIVALY